MSVILSNHNAFFSSLIKKYIYLIENNNTFINILVLSRVVTRGCLPNLISLPTFLSRDPISYNGGLDCFSRVVQEEGWGALYAGFTTLMFSIIPEVVMSGTCLTCDWSFVQPNFLIF